MRSIEVFMARLNEGRRSSRSTALVRIAHPACCLDPTSPHLRRIVSPFLLWTLSFVISAFCGSTTPALGQTDVNDVHIVPRVEKEVPKESLVAPGLKAHVRPLKVDVDLVLVPVTITDPLNRLVTGLEKENFQLMEGSAAQEIRTFSSEDAPVSLGVIFDSSGSMSSKMDRAKDAVIEFFKTANPQDEFFMITFSDAPEEVTDFKRSVPAEIWASSNDEQIENHLRIADLQAHVVEGVAPRFRTGIVPGHCDCMFFVNTYRWDFPLVAALAAPRPVLLGNSDVDDIFPTPGYRRLADKRAHLCFKSCFANQAMKALFGKSLDLGEGFFANRLIQLSLQQVIDLPIDELFNRDGRFLAL